MDVSIVIPLYNEVENIADLYAAVTAVTTKLDREWELILVNDGSTDGTTQKLKEIAQRDSCVKVINFRGNFGQTAAMEAGLKAACGDAVVTLDGDLQNDPTDIPKLLEKLDEGYDLVHGWRKDRQDALVLRKVPSWLANRLISWVTNVPVHDLGCTLKAMRREVAHELCLIGEMHRFIPILAAQRGAKCAEVVTKHHPRTKGTSKYGISRVPRVLLDLLTVHYLTRYLVSPMKFFGMVGFACAGLAALSGFATIAMKVTAGIDMTGNPFLLLTVLSVMTGVQFLAIGLLGELLTRIYFESRGLPPYAIREQLNFQEPEAIEGPHLRRAA
ncbi:glycosyltransferase family 2 protein [Calycomorphotria hydatis]|uniref:Undecaprenyl-phosphate 4-deoxy-4-formamido-L-arabinose transferase n=1 Tax=Calycomorphotria hydatis TaxID=2528027 RepID=A0A517TCC3_9PLAN|nr:glycosyltransferase family 2 protein [Calycomorphotria hydatis]QDT66016.1 Undecaprenyl-phosphate 4-deoxy-4-formamido-L-arabinose transferase [Calycomorphotria hydatis]